MHGVQLSMMNCWFANEEKTINLKGMLMIVFLKKVFGHVPFNWSKLAAKFLQFQNNHIRVVVIGTRVN